MLFILTKAIVHRALDDINKASINVMRSLEACLKYGKHMVFAKNEVLEYIQQKANQEYPSLISLLSSYSTIGAAAKEMSWHAEFVAEIPSRRDQENHIIYINENELPKLELIKEAHVIGEHLKDVLFVEHIINYYQREHSLKPQHRYYRLLGGGSSIASVYENEITEGHAFVLCITDGDKKYPKDGIGDTGGNVEKKDNEYHHPYNAFYYQMQEVTEMENLIPWHIILKYVSVAKDPQMNERVRKIQQIRDADESFLDYFDYKEGISKSKETDDAVLKYRMDIMKLLDPEIANTMQVDEQKWLAQKQRFVEEGLAQDIKEAEKMIKYIRKKLVYVPGICENVLERVLETCKDDLAVIRKTDLSEAQQHEYERIGELAYAWTCCMVPMS